MNGVHEDSVTIRGQSAKHVPNKLVMQCIFLRPILLSTNTILITTNHDKNVHNTYTLITGYTFTKNTFPTISHSQIYVYIHTRLRCISYNLEQLQSNEHILVYTVQTQKISAVTIIMQRHNSKSKIVLLYATKA